MRDRKNPDIDSVRSTRRIISFSDGVFAVAITLLVVQLPIPVNAPNHELGGDITANMPMLISYGISFGVIALNWLKHLAFNNHVRRYSVGLIWLNFLYLMVIAFLPFPTAVYGTHFSDEVAQILYAGAVCTAGYLASLMWVWTLRTPSLLHKGIDLGEVRHSLYVSLIMPTGFAVSIPGSLIYPPAVPYIWIGFAAATPFLRKL
ncbi:MAG: TMEM175 family protein [Actinobacteria bacterium]|nr:TMEM175 family protein [Actinomycetota bacterium]